MIIIVYASILISAVMSPGGKEAAFILDHNDKIDLVAPEFIYEEVNSKKEKIIAGSHHNQYSLSESLRLLYNMLTVFPVDRYKPDTLIIAEQLTNSIDIKDANTLHLPSFWKVFFGHVI